MYQLADYLQQITTPVTTIPIYVPVYINNDGMYYLILNEQIQTQNEQIQIISPSATVAPRVHERRSEKTHRKNTSPEPKSLISLYGGVFLLSMKGYSVTVRLEYCYKTKLSDMKVLHISKDDVVFFNVDDINKDKDPKDEVKDYREEAKDKIFELISKEGILPDAIENDETEVIVFRYEGKQYSSEEMRKISVNINKLYVYPEAQRTEIVILTYENVGGFMEDEMNEHGTQVNMVQQTLLGEDK